MTTSIASCTRIALIFGMTLLTGCAQVIGIPGEGKSQAQFDRDIAICKQHALRVTDGSDGFVQCMIAKGNTIEYRDLRPGQPKPLEEFTRRPTEPRMTPVLREALNSAQECTIPAPATLSQEFKYGCFCGANHPNIQIDNGKNLSALTPDDKERLIAKYYRIRPIDQIDAACMTHDVCWILRDDTDGVCNRLLEQKMDALTQKYNKLDTGFTFNLLSGMQRPVNKYFRCKNLARDISAATKSGLIADNTPMSAVKNIFNGLFLAPTHPATSVLRNTFGVVGGGQGEYPAPAERCD